MASTINSACPTLVTVRSFDWPVYPGACDAMTVGPYTRLSAEVWIAGMRPNPVSVTGVLGFTGSLVPIVSTAGPRGPGPDGLNRTVSARLLPAPIATGNEGAPTIEKSAAFGPLML